MSPGAGRFLGRDPIGYEDGWNFYRLYISLHKRDPSGNGCNLCFKPGRLKKVIYEPDDPDEIAACIYEFVADPQNPRHGIMTGAHMTECQRQDGCKNVGDCSDLNLDLDEMRIQRAVAPIGGALPFTRPRCPDTPEIPDSCLAITAKDCPDFGRSLQDCLNACESSEGIENYCKLFPTKPLQELCKWQLEQGQELCREYCRIRRIRLE